MNNDSSKHPLEWFEARVGQAIYREPIFESEKNRPTIAMKIKDKNHAKLLFDLQRKGRPMYQDTPTSFVRSHQSAR